MCVGILRDMSMWSKNSFHTSELTVNKNMGLCGSSINKSEETSTEDGVVKKSQENDKSIKVKEADNSSLKTSLLKPSSYTYSPALKGIHWL